VDNLIDAFVAAPDDGLHPAFRRLTAALWRDGARTDRADAAVPVLAGRLGEVDDRRTGYLAILLGLLAETEYPLPDGPVSAAIRAGLDPCLDLLGDLGPHDPLGLALCYLLAHFPADRGRILAAAHLDPDDRSRLERALADLDPGAPVLGRVFPSPAAWRRHGPDAAFDRRWISTLSPEQVRRGWHADTRTAWGGLGAKAYWAVRNQASPAPLPPAAFPSLDRIPRAAAPATDIFGPHAAALRCPGCGGEGALCFDADRARCAACGATYPMASGILDLTGPSAGGQADDFTFMLAENPGMGLFYETLARPNFLRLCGGNWDGAVTPAVEDEYIARHVDPADGPVLDLAAGAGRWTEVLAKAVGPERVIALDLNGPMLSMLRARLPAVPAVMAGAAALPFATRSLGAVMCWNALQAFPAEAPAVVAEVGRCLRPGGTFTLMTFRNSDDPVYRHFVAAHTFSQYAGGPRPFEPSELRGWLAAANLKIREESGPGTFVFITAERV
jgi:SAM-dependent methyltransferase